MQISRGVTAILGAGHYIEKKTNSFLRFLYIHVHCTKFSLCVAPSPLLGLGLEVIREFHLKLRVQDISGINREGEKLGGNLV